MDGPMSGSGIMVLLHDPVVLPQMRDLAYAISPGSHTLLPVSHTEVRPNRHSSQRIKTESRESCPKQTTVLLYFSLNGNKYQEV